MIRTFRGGWPVALLLAALLGLGCSRCGHPTTSTAESPASLLPAHALAVVSVPHVLALGQKVSKLSELRVFGLVASLTGAGADGPALVRGVVEQVGVDFTSEKALRDAGLDPNGPMLAAQLPGGAEALVLTANDAQTLTATIARLAKQRLQAGLRQTQGEVVTFSRAQSQAPALAFAQRGALTVVVAGPGCASAVAASLRLTASQSLAARPDFAAFSKAHAKSDLLAWVPAERSLQSWGVTGGARLALTLDPHQLGLDAEIPLTTAQGLALSSVHGSAGAALVHDLDPDAFLLARTGADPATLWPLLDAVMPRQLGRALAAAGLHPDKLLGSLAPGAALSLALPPTLNLSVLPSMDPRATNPFRFVNLAARATAKDPAPLLAALAQAQRAPAALGARIATRNLGAVPVYTFEYALGEGASVALRESEVIVTGGEGRMAALLARPPKQGAGVPPPIAKAFDDAGVAVWLDMPKLVAGLRAVPDSAFGLGGFAIRAALGRWLDAISDFKGGLVLGTVRADPAGSVLAVEAKVALP